MKETEFKALMKRAEKKVKSVLQQRCKEYGDFRDIASFVNTFYIANMDSVIDRITYINDDEYHRAMVALFMLAMKLARIENEVENPHFDSVLDFLAYLSLLKEVGLQGLELKTHLKGSKLHKRLIEYANFVLKDSE